MTKKLAIIGAGSAACRYANAARNLGVETHCFAWSKGAQAADVVDVFHDISITEVDTIAQMCKDLGINGIVHTSEATMLPTAQIAELAGLIGNPVEVARRITSKWENRERAKNVEGLCQPRYWRVSDLNEIPELGIPYPFIIKPTSEAGKRGVSVARNEKEFAEALEYSANEPNRAHLFIVEEFMPSGPEFCAENLTYHGVNTVVQITGQFTSAPPHCLEIGHEQPARLSPEMRARVEDVMDRLLTAVGMQNGGSCIEFKIVGDDIYLIEVNGRPSGDLMSEVLVPLSTGYPYWEAAVQIALDEFQPIDKSKFKHDYSGVWFMNQYTKAIRPWFDDAENHDWCYRKYVSPTDGKDMMHNGDDVSYFVWHTTDKPLDFPEV